jgi:hypothetical protein
MGKYPNANAERNILKASRRTATATGGWALRSYDADRRHPPRYRHVPDAVRVKLIPLIDEYRSNGLAGATTLGVNLYEAIGKISPQATGDMKMIRSLFLEAEWWQVYDLCETLVKLCRFREQIAERIDAMFSEEGVPYRMTANGIVWRFSEAAEEAVTYSHLLERDRVVLALAIRTFFSALW